MESNSAAHLKEYFRQIKECEELLKKFKAEIKNKKRGSKRANCGTYRQHKLF